MNINHHKSLASAVMAEVERCVGLCAIPGADRVNYNVGENALTLWFYGGRRLVGKVFMDFPITITEDRTSPVRSSEEP